MSAAPTTKGLDLLLRAQVIDRARYERAVALVGSTHERGEDVLIDGDLLPEATLLKALSSVYRTPFVSTEKLAKASIPRSTVQLIPRRVAETLGVFPVVFDRNSGVLSVVTADPDSADVLREVKHVSGAREVKAFVARPAAVLAAIRKHHGGDARAFERFQRQTAYDFGQQVLMPDGRVVPPREGTRRSVSIPEEELSVDRMTPVDRLSPVPPRRAGDDRGSAPPESSLSMPPLPTAQRETTRRQTHVERDLVRSTGTPSPSSRPAQVAQEVQELQRAHEEGTLELLGVMVSLLENARQELRGHSAQVARFLRRVADRMGLDRADTYALVAAGHIHDLGKMGQFHLTALNCGEYDGHRSAAQKAFETPLRLLEAVRLPAGVKSAVFHMYERFDGKGFPDKLVGKDIPLGARVLAAADTYADLTQNARNPFRKVLSPAEAMDVLSSHKGTIFDPAILDLLRALVLGEDMKAKLLADRFRALIIEPDPEESTVLELRMFEQGFDVRIARTLEAARRLAATDGVEIDVVVSELDLPDGDGLALLGEARERWGRDLAWIVHTRRQGRTEAQRAFELGASDFVAKPVQADVLVAKIKAMLDQRAQAGRAGAPKGVSGSLREMGLPDIVQVLFHGRKTGKLDVMSGPTAGQIHFQEGAIVNAVLGAVSGVDAFYALVRFQDGEFAFDPSFSPSRRIITDSAETLLLEGMRRMDEGI